MRRLLALLVFFNIGCSSALFRQDPTVGVALTGVESIARPTAQIRQAVAAKPDAECDREARMFYFVTHLPAVSEVYQLDLYLSQKAPNASEPKYIGRCVLNPFSPQNVAQEN